MKQHRKLKNEELDRLQAVDYKDAVKTSLVIILDNVRSLNNIGSVFRTADCFLVEKIFLCGITAQPPHRDIRKTALGATETVPWSYSESTLDVVNHLTNTGYTTCAIEQAENSISLYDAHVKTGEKLAIVLGNEVQGVQQEVVDACDKVIELEQYGTKHSLNISVCAGIVVYDLYHKLKSASTD